MRSLWLSLLGVLAAAAVSAFGIIKIDEARIPPGEGVEEPFIETNQTLMTVNTARIGSDDPVETAVAVANIIYPVTESENAPGAVILVNRNNLAEVMVAANRVQHFPVNAPLLFVDENSIPDLTRSELKRLQPEGVPMDGNAQVYLVGTIGDVVRQDVEEMGYKVRVLTADNPVDLAVAADDWTSTQHGDHRNEVAVVNLDHLEYGIPSMFWNAHRGDGLAFVTDDGIPQATIDMLERRAAGPWIYIYGNEDVFSPELARELAQYGHVTRIRGETPGAVSANFAAFHDEGKDWGAWFTHKARAFGWGIGEAGHNAVFVNIDGPGGWQNAVTATTLSHMGKHAPVLILDDGSIPDAVNTYLSITKPYETAPQQQLLNHGWIIGGEDTISWDVQAQLDAILEAKTVTGSEEQD